MTDIERKQINLLEDLLVTISESMGNYSDCGWCDDLFIPGFQRTPVFELDSEDIEVIENISEHNIHCKYIIDAYKAVLKNFIDK